MARRRLLVLAQMVLLRTPNRFVNTVTLTPLARAVLIASASASVSRVRTRCLVSAAVSIRGASGSPAGSVAPPDPRSRAKINLSIRRRRFPKCPMGSTSRTELESLPTSVSAKVRSLPHLRPSGIPKTSRARRATRSWKTNENRRGANSDWPRPAKPSSNAVIPV